MKLSEQQFEQLLQKNRLILSLIGVSNIGKTYWSKKFSDVDFRHINCDDLIEAKLAPVLKELGYSGIEGVSRWMGQLYDERFSANQQKYLSLERETMQNIFGQIKKEGNQNIIIDTTGSIVHTGKDVCDKLKKSSLVVYIEATEDIHDEMFNQYIEKPKPVVFEGVFVPLENETVMQNLKRCYRKLLNLRSALYAEYADVIIPRETIKENMGVKQFILLIKQSL